MPGQHTNADETLLSPPPSVNLEKRVRSPLQLRLEPGFMIHAVPFMEESNLETVTNMIV